MNRFLALGLVLFLAPSRSSAQGEAAMPFLQISPVPDGNGWGNISTALRSDNPIAAIANPAQVGMFSLAGHFAASSYSNKTDWLPAFSQSDLTYNAWGFSAGLNLQEAFCLPFGLSAGLGHSGIDLNLGEFVSTGSGGPDPIGTFEAYEQSRNVTLAFGLEYLVRFGIGWNFKNVQSKLGPVGGPDGTTARAEAMVSTTDFGLLLEVPVVDIHRTLQNHTTVSTEGVQPLLDLSFGYSVANRGDKHVSYLAATATDPLPRFAIVGAGLEIGITSVVRGERWKILGFTLAREADDILVTRFPDGSFEYQSGFGDILFFRNVVGGKADTNCVNSRKGWQVNLGECVYVRGGSYSELVQCGARNYSTFGFAFRLKGALRLLEVVSPGSTGGSFIAFIADHVDVMYDHAEYAEHSFLGGTTFSALTVTYR